MIPTFASVIIELTNRCNFSCPFCPSDAITRERGLMDPGLMDKLLTEIAGQGLASTVQFGLMGEPFLHKSLFSMVEAGKRRGLTVRVFTNGSRLTEETVEAVLVSGIDELYISFRGVDEAAFGLLSKMDFASYRQGIARLLSQAVARRFPGKIILKVFKDTVYEQALGTRELGRRLSAQSVEARLEAFFDFLPDRPRFAKRQGRANHEVRVAQNIGVRLETVSPWVSLEKSGQPGFHKGYIGACDGLSGHFGILWNGDVTTCCKDYDGKNVFGNAARDSLTDILGSPEGRRLRTSLGRCWLPTEYCRLCRGGDTVKDALVHQLGTIVLFKTPILKRLVLGLDSQ